MRCWLNSLPVFFSSTSMWCLFTKKEKEEQRFPRKPSHPINQISPHYFVRFSAGPSLRFLTFYTHAPGYGCHRNHAYINWVWRQICKSFAPPTAWHTHTHTRPVFMCVCVWSFILKCITGLLDANLCVEVQGLLLFPPKLFLFGGWLSSSGSWIHLCLWAPGAVVCVNYHES